MIRKYKGLAIAGMALVALLVSGATIATASGDDEGAADDVATERAITGDALDKASEAALTHTGGGVVTGTEVDDEESFYEVEVTTDEGRQIDVQLDRSFKIVSGERAATTN
jgi:uncharacterized membrane protein YkoI